MRNDRFDYSKKFNKEKTKQKNEDFVNEEIEKEEEKEPEKIMAKVNVVKLNLRSDPFENPDNIVRELYEGEELLVSSFYGDDWCEVHTQSGNTGYVMKKYVTIKTV